MSFVSKTDIPRRVCAAAGAIAAWLLLAWSLDTFEGQVSAAFVFLFVMGLCTAVVVLVRGLGWLWGAGAGLTVGLVVSASLAGRVSATGSSLGAFVGLSALILCLLAGVAGAAGKQQRCQSNPRGAISASASHAAAAVPPGGTAQRRRFMYASANMANDFCAWVDSPAGRQCCMESQDWSAFDQFVRTTLRQHLHAGGVRLYELTAGGAWLEPLVRPAAGPPPRLAAGEGAVARAISSGQAVVVDEMHVSPQDRDSNACQPTSASPGALPLQPGSEQRTPRWLLPLRTGTRTEVLVTVAGLDLPHAHEEHLANAVRVQLQLFWRQISAARLLSRYLRIDRQTGMLERVELLNFLDELVGACNRKGEPVMVLALALEGMRKLDDAGFWRQRDSLIQDLGRALRAKIRADDVLGRFSDDRFVVVLRGLEPALATRVAEKLLDTVRAQAIQAACQLNHQGRAEPWQLKVRAGLAGIGPHCAPCSRPFATFDPQAGAPPTPEAVHTGQSVLQRALGLIEYARRERVELVTDLMAGVPDSLARNPRGYPPQTQSPATVVNGTGQSPASDANQPMTMECSDDTACADPH